MTQQEESISLKLRNHINGYLNSSRVSQKSLAAQLSMSPTALNKFLKAKTKSASLLLLETAVVVLKIDPKEIINNNKGV